MPIARYLLIAVLAAAAIAAAFHAPSSNKVPVTVETGLIRTPSLRGKGRAPKMLVVYVAGAVKRPGLYRLPEGTRAFNAVSRAGGLRDDADPAGIDLAEVLFDGEEVAAPLHGVHRTPAHGIRKPARPPKRSKIKTPQEIQLDLNTAGAEDLARLPGIGDEMARRLVRFRDVNGPFASLDELADVAGMTQHRIDLVTPSLYVP